MKQRPGFGNENKLKAFFVIEVGPIISTTNDLIGMGYELHDGYLTDPEGHEVHEISSNIEPNKNYEYVIIIVENDGILIPISKTDVSPSTLEMLAISEKNPDDELLDALVNDGIVSVDSADGSEIFIFPYETNEVYDLT